MLNLITNILPILIGVSMGIQGEVNFHPIQYVEAKEAPIILEETIEDKIRKYDWEDEIAIKVMQNEGAVPEALNPEWHRNYLTGENICQGSYGLFQIACIHNLENPEALFDEDFNIKKAYELYEKEGWRPWSVCKNGKVDCGL